MRWDDKHESDDLIDERRAGAAFDLGGLLWWLGPWLMRSWPGRLVLLGIVVFALYQGHAQRFATVESSTPGGGSVVTDQAAHFVAFVLDDVQRSWEDSFRAQGKPYRHAKLVLFTDATRTGCGYGEAETGPFYCPRDERVYIDLGFYRKLGQMLGIRGEFAEAYVIAHEIGHHVQNLLGISERENAHGTGATGGSVRLELQADCFAGIWAHSTAQRSLLEHGDIESAMTAAAAVGDDHIERKETGRVRPDTFTHGTSQQRQRWFERGYQTGRLDACDTFGASAL
jgi:uncharacterized protein